MASTELTADDLKNILTFSIQLAREAGKVIVEGSAAILSSSSNQIEEKKNAVDLVTQYDKQVEDLVKKKIGEAYPTFKLCV